MTYKTFSSHHFLCELNLSFLMLSYDATKTSFVHFFYSVFHQINLKLIDFILTRKYAEKNYEMLTK